MKHLLRISSHGNNVTVIDNIKDHCIIKTSSTTDGITHLKKEKEGITWYASRLNLNKNDLISYAYETKLYARLNIQKFTGTQICYKQAFLRNTTALEQVIAHYMTIWPQHTHTPIHGDLTLDNIIFTSQGVRLFDWEHFSAKPHLWGFDALYCLLSALLLPLKPDECPTQEEYAKFIELLFILINNGLSAELSEYPLAKYRKIFKEEGHWVNIVKNSPNKLFPLQYDELYADIIDDQITRRIRHTRYDIWKQKQ